MTFRRVKIILSYRHFFKPKTHLELICSRDFVVCLLFQYLRDTISRFKVSQQKLPVECSVSEILRRISVGDYKMKRTV